MNDYSYDIITEVLEGKADRQTQHDVLQWFATPQGQKVLSEYMDEKHLNKPECEPVYPSDTVWARIHGRMRTRHTLRRRIWRWSYGVISVFLLLFLSLTTYIVDRQIGLFGAEEWISISVPRGEKRQVSFQDGTLVCLGPGAKLDYPKRFSLWQRKVRFSGEAYFDVATNKHRPFIVEMPEGTITVKGTAFNVMNSASSSEMRICLEKGHISFWNQNLSQEYDMKAGETLRYDKKGKVVKLGRTDMAQQYINWKTGDFVFHDTPLLQVLDVVGREYGMTFEVEDPSLNGICYTIRLGHQTLESVLKSLEYITPVRFSIEGGIIKVKAAKGSK
jgi:transmembrane sensor